MVWDHEVVGSIPTTPTNKEHCMPMYETTVKTPQGEEKKRLYANDVKEAKKLFEQLYGGPRAVPYIPHTVPS
jgi:hypothetical protein